MKEAGGKQMRKKHSRYLLLLAPLFLLLAAGYALRWEDEEEEVLVYKEETVSFGDLVQGIMESGTVELHTQNQTYELVLKDGEDEEDEDEEEEQSRHLKIEELYVQQGQRIRAGEPLLKLTQRSLSSLKRYLEGEAADAQIALEKLQNEYEIAQAEAEGIYQKSLSDAQWSEEQYSIAQGRIFAETAAADDSAAVLEAEIAQLEQELADDWEEYADLKEEYEMYQRRYEEWDPENLYTYIPLRTKYLSVRDQYEAATEERCEKRQKIAEKQEEILQVQQEAERLLGQSERKELDARQSYETATLAGSMAQQVYDQSLQSLQRQIASAQQELWELLEKQEELNAFAGEDGIVYTEGSGLVTGVYYEVGDWLEEQSTLLTYVEEDAYVLSIALSEEDIPYVEVGETVDIAFTAYPEETYQGKIIEIAGTQPLENTATVSYPVTVEILGDTSRLYGGMTGEVTFVTEQVLQTLYVSRRAIVTEEGKDYVLVRDKEGNMEKQRVETGFTDGFHIQILSGVSEGDAVYIESRMKAAEQKKLEQEEKETSAEKEAVQKEAVQKEAVQKEAAQKEAVQKEAAEKETPEKETVEKAAGEAGTDAASKAEKAERKGEWDAEMERE